MSIPDFQSIMLPLLEFASDKKEHSLKEAVEKLAKKFNLTEEEKREMLPSKRAFLFYNRTAWAKHYLSAAGFLESSERGIFRITARGLDTIREKPDKINLKYLNKFPEFKEFRAKKNEAGTAAEKSKKVNVESTPEEQIEESYQDIR